jgi:hypothetical protein
MDVFYDDWAALSLDDGSFGSKADNHLKVNYQLYALSLVRHCLTVWIQTMSAVFFE